MTYDERELKYLINKAWLKSVQVIVQSRLGVRFNENLSIISPIKGNVPFYIKVDDNCEVTTEFKKSFENQTVSVENPYSMEILLRTKDNEMILEVWTLFVEELIDPLVSTSSPASRTAHSRMSLLIKSCMASARLTPAWDLAFRQGHESYVICYRMYIGQPQLEGLGKDISKHHVGEVNVQLFHIRMQVAYRTKLTFDSRQKISPYDQMMLKSDHFKADSSPKHRRNRDRCFDTASVSEDQASSSRESQEVPPRPYTNSPLDFRVESPRSRTSSESSHRGSQANFSEPLIIPFANRYRTSTTTDDLLSEFPTANLLIEAVDQEKAEERRQEIKALKERRISESKMTKMRPDRLQQSSAQASRSLPKEDDYVVLDIKTPFALGEGSDVELTNFYKGIQHAPDLASFSIIDDVLDIEKELERFELVADEFDDLVKSINSDIQSSESLDLS